jgi:hypothetical protein
VSAIGTIGTSRPSRLSVIRFASAAACVKSEEERESERERERVKEE